MLPFLPSHAVFWRMAPKAMKTVRTPAPAERLKATDVGRRQKVPANTAFKGVRP